MVRPVSTMHAKLLVEISSFCETSGAKWLNMTGLTLFVGTSMQRKRLHSFAIVTFRSVAMTRLLSWALGRRSRPRRFVFTWVLPFCSGTRSLHLEGMMHAAFPAEMQEETTEQGPLDVVEEQEDIGLVSPEEEIIAEETKLDELDIPNLPVSEQDIGGECGRDCRNVFGFLWDVCIVNLATCPSKCSSTYCELQRLTRSTSRPWRVKSHCCVACEETAPKKGSHQTSLPADYKFNRSRGIDVLEVTDALGKPFSFF